MSDLDKEYGIYDEANAYRGKTTVTIAVRFNRLARQFGKSIRATCLRNIGEPLYYVWNEDADTFDPMGVDDD